MAAMKSPRRMPSAASPMLCVPVEQAVTMHMFGPRAPGSMAIWPDAVSGSMLAMKNGLTDLRALRLHGLDGVGHEARARRRPEPKMTPMSSRSSGVDLEARSRRAPAWRRRRRRPRCGRCGGRP